MRVDDREGRSARHDAGRIALRHIVFHNVVVIRLAVVVNHRQLRKRLRPAVRRVQRQRGDRLSVSRHIDLHALRTQLLRVIRVVPRLAHNQVGVRLRHRVDKRRHMPGSFDRAFAARRAYAHILRRALSDGVARAKRNAAERDALAVAQADARRAAVKVQSARFADGFNRLGDGQRAVTRIGSRVEEGCAYRRRFHHADSAGARGRVAIRRVIRFGDRVARAGRNAQNRERSAARNANPRRHAARRVVLKGNRAAALREIRACQSDIVVSAQGNGKFKLAPEFRRSAV